MRALDLLPAPFDAVARAAGISVLALFGTGLLTVLVAIALSASQVGALWDQLHAGLVGGSVLALLQVALLPTLGVWVLAVLCGGAFTMGLGTSVSLGSVSTGVLPALPILGALPAPGPVPGWMWALLVLPIGAVALGAIRLVRDLRDADRRTRLIAGGSFAAAVIMGTLLLMGLATAGIGGGRLRVLGPDLAATALPLIGIVVLTTAAVLLAHDAEVLRRVRGARSSLRDRVERSESAEHDAPTATTPAAETPAVVEGTAVEAEPTTGRTEIEPTEIESAERPAP